MTLKTIKQIHDRVMNLGNEPKNLKLCNAYIDQALINFSYETMKAVDQSHAIRLIIDMIEKFNLIRGR